MKRVLIAAAAGGAAAAAATAIAMMMGWSASAQKALPAACAAAAAVTVMRTRKQESVAPPTEKAQPRERPAQIVGSNCVACKERIVLLIEGARCEKCGAPLHRTCLGQHACSPQ
jgi:hypothetical protein